MNQLFKLFTIFLLTIGLVIVPAISINPISTVNAQSQSATQQQASSPTSSQNSSKPQVGQVFTFNEKAFHPMRSSKNVLI